MEFAPARAARAAHFEQVGEIGGKIEGDFDPARRQVEIVERQAIMAGAAEQEALAAQMDQAVLQIARAGRARRDAGLVMSQVKVALSSRTVRAQQQRPHAAEGEEQF